MGIVSWVRRLTGGDGAKGEQPYSLRRQLEYEMICDDPRFERRAAVATLTVTEGPWGVGQRHLVGPDVTSIGRVGMNDVCLGDPAMEQVTSLGKRHCGIRYQDGAFEIASFNPRKNSVAVNGALTDKGPLVDGDSITLGIYSGSFVTLCFNVVSADDCQPYKEP
ncbi:MAG: hypothetical protein ACI9MR_004359 [Myxococcota bacterium]|jgi:hypothetical protein